MKNEFATLKDFRRWFDRYVEQGYGRKCRDFAWDCAVCRAHFVKDVLDDFIEDAIATDQWFKRQRKPKPKQ